jgi:carbon starvation protein
MVLWPLFGSLNQLMAALALGVVTVWFHRKGIHKAYTLVPMILILGMTLWAMVRNLLGFLGEGEWLLVFLSALILSLTLWLVAGSIGALLRKDQ